MDDSPEQVYEERAARFEAECTRETQRWNRISNFRLLAFVAAALSVAAGWWQEIPALWVLGGALLAVFFVLVWYHGRVGKLRQRFEELFRINSEALMRLRRQWDKLPLRHRFRAEHGGMGDPYAGDLDIFGHASLMHLLETVGTFMGESTLARWLRRPAPPETVGERQEAVRELAPMLDLRDELYLLGRLMGEEKPDPGPFLEWAEDEPWLRKNQWVRWVAYVGLLLFWALVLADILNWISYPLWFLVAAANVLFTLTVGRTVHEIIEHAQAGEQGFKHYAGAFQMLSEAPFQSAGLKRLQATLSAGGVPAHTALRRLHRIATWTLPESMLYLVIEAITFWEIHHLGVLERWQRDLGKQTRAWLETLGEAEALSALAGLSHANRDWAFPAVERVAECVEGHSLGHPLLPDPARVDNDVTVGPPGTFLLVTGSNMSGKSTLLRAIGVNVVLAQAGGPVCASWMHLPPVEMWTSMRVEDSLERGVSYFMAELQRLKEVVDAARRVGEEGERRMLYLLDEILQGTNTEERQIAARRVIMYLVSQGALGAVSTHDLTLADEPAVAAAALPVHFTESIRDGAGGPQMTFDYKLRPGIATSTNALKLMEIVGLDLEEPEEVRR
jgi:hypothetical protein